MLSAFVRTAEGSARRLDSLEDVIEAWSGEPPGLWIDLENPGEVELKEIGELFALDAGALEDCITGEQRPRIDEFDDHIFVVVYAIPGIDHDIELEPRKLAAFLGARLLITVHREPLPTVTGLRDHRTRLALQSVGRGVDFVLYSIIDGMVDRYTMLAEAYEARLDELEDTSLAPDVDESILASLSSLRRQLLELRGMAASQRELLLPVARGEYDFISDALETRFSHVVDHLTKTVEVIDGLRELLNGVRDNYHTAIANRMNEVMKTLTVFATIMLPLGLIAGIYGMNLPIWPSPEQPLSFWAVVGVMAAIASGMLLYFRRRGWV